MRAQLDALLHVVFPATCSICQSLLIQRSPTSLCEACAEALPRNLGPRCHRCDKPGRCTRCASAQPQFSRLRAPFLYGGGIADMVQSAKLEGREDLCAALGRLLVEDEEVLALAAQTAAYVPVPLGRWRALRRGYNPAAYLARALTQQTGRPTIHALIRHRETRPQMGLLEAARRDNVAGCMRARRRLQGAVLLIDDVVTTGATLEEAARAARAAGAQEVFAVAVATTTQ